jgi:tetratricopeptide (TPR) repeat protein
MHEQGQALLAGGRFHEAVALFTGWLRQQPDSLPARLGLARAHAGTGEVLTAIAWLSDAHRRAPDAREPLQMLADALLLQRDCAQAAPLYEALVARADSRTAANLLHAGFCAEAIGQVEPAIARYREAIAADEALVEAHVDLAGMLWRVEDFEGSLRHAQRAVELAPAQAYARRILGTALLNLNRLAEAEEHLRAALRTQPDFPMAQLDLAFVLLLAGRLAEGWPLYEHRWRDGRLPRPAFFRPDREWAGPSESLEGRAIAVYSEQGWGDVLQMLRYLPRLQALGARVCCVVGAPLVPLVEASFPGVECLRPGRPLQVQSHIAFMELPGRLGTTLESIPRDVPYLRVPAEAQARWRERLLPWQDRVKVGLAWSGSRVQVNNRNRALPLGLLLPLARLPGVGAVIRHQYESAAARRAGFQPAAVRRRGMDRRAARRRRAGRLHLRLDGLRRERGHAPAAGPGDHRRYRGCALGRRPGQAGVDPARAERRLALAAGARGLALVSGRPPVPAGLRRRPGGAGRARARRARGVAGGPLTLRAPAARRSPGLRRRTP